MAAKPEDVATIALNRYLYDELGVDGDEARIGPGWPFALRLTGERGIYTFEADGESLYAVDEPVTACWVAAGMSPADIRLQQRGAMWIGAREPVDLETTSIGDPRVPPVSQRRARLEAMAIEALGPGARVLEGLLLARIGVHVVFAVGSDGRGAMALDGAQPLEVGFPDASAWRRLAWGVGHLLATGALSETLAP